MFWVLVFFCFSVVGTHISVSRNDVFCRNVLQKESTSRIPAGQLEWEAVKSVEASTACIRSLCGKTMLLFMIMKNVICLFFFQMKAFYIVISYQVPIVSSPSTVVSCKLCIWALGGHKSNLNPQTPARPSQCLEKKNNKDSNFKLDYSKIYIFVSW